MERIKILYVSQATGGVKRHITFLVQRLDPSRYEIAGCFPPQDRIKGAASNKETYFDVFQKRGLRAIPLDMYREIHPIQDLRAFLKLFRILRRERWDIVHTHSSKAGFLGRIAARVAGVPVVVHTPNAFAFDRPPHSFLNPFYVFLEKMAGYFCDALIAVSDSEEQLAGQAGVVSAKKIICIPNGIDLEEMSCEVDPQAKKRMLGLPENKPMILTIGRFAPQKAPGLFIESAKQILAQRSDVSFVMVGDGPLLQRVKDRIQKEGLQNHLFLFGWRSDVKEILAACDIYVLSSLWEGLPYTVLEAMALAKPVVATAARGTRDAVRDGVTGFLVGLRDEKTMAGKLLKLLSEPDLARGMGQQGRLLVEKEFTIGPHVQKTDLLYQRLLSEKQKRP
ncbi:MAG: glycosyltransferase family 4 protein [Candidatus Omnitrophota bacterium]